MVASDGCSSEKIKSFDLRRSSRHCHDAEMDRRAAEVKNRSLTGRMDFIGERGRPSDRNGSSSLAERKTQARNQQPLVDCRTRGWKGLRGKYSQIVSKDRA